MGTATLVYSRSRTLTGAILRGSDRWGRWSHCGVVTPDNFVIESRAPGGVVETPWGQFIERVTHHELVRIEVPDPAAGLKWLRKQVGLPYDYYAIFGNLLRESWQDDLAWQCAELAEAYLAQCGKPRFRQEIWRISPNLSWSVL